MSHAGPYETERDATLGSLWHLRGRGDIGGANKDALAVELVGVERGEFDRRILDWLAGWEPSTVTVVCGLIARTRAAGRETPQTGVLVIDRGWMLTVLQLVRDAIAWQREIGDDESAEQAALYREVAASIGITEQAVGGVENVRYRGQP